MCDLKSKIGWDISHIINILIMNMILTCMTWCKGYDGISGVPALVITRIMRDMKSNTGWDFSHSNYMHIPWMRDMICKTEWDIGNISEIAITCILAFYESTVVATFKEQNIHHIYEWVITVTENFFLRSDSLFDLQNHFKVSVVMSAKLQQERN